MSLERVRVESWQLRELEENSGRVAAVVDGMKELKVGSRVFVAPIAIPAQRVGGEDAESIASIWERGSERAIRADWESDQINRARES